MQELALLFLLLSSSVLAEPIFHEKKYPEGKRPFAAVVQFHTSGEFSSKSYISDRGEFFLKEGFAIYVPDFFKRHGITSKTRKKTWMAFRKPIEKELSEIIEFIKKDPKIDPNNVFAVAYSNGGYWATYMAATKQVNAASSHYGVWQWGKI